MYKRVSYCSLSNSSFKKALSKLLKWQFSSLLFCYIWRSIVALHLIWKKRTNYSLNCCVGKRLRIRCITFVNPKDQVLVFIVIIIIKILIDTFIVTDYNESNTKYNNDVSENYLTKSLVKRFRPHICCLKGCSIREIRRYYCSASE